ncbi:sigma-54 interaction domain-containing protein [Bacilliculturomica massiliensis]|uniref:sigma-54 interaction domain-containing protein n=1 Tax=Bacilliculturomica massiliensis TaxID=1917867 RepID=UPI0012B9FFAF|nr:sigma 54-interacting transcriptional regulator [Bacilliculturomica massiliensis]
MKMLNRYVEQTLKIFSNADSIMIVDENAIIRYYYTKYPDVSALKGTDVLGKKLLDAYPYLTEESSYIMQCLRTGKSFMNCEQTFTSFLGTTIHTISSEIPIHDGGKMVGVADIAIYLDKPIEKKNLSIEFNTDQYLNQNNGYDLEDIITQDPNLNDIKEKIRLSSDSDAPVLVYGKTGTGKELIVNAVHKCSSRHDGPLIVQNCAAIPATLLESILFGTVRGSFTGASDTMGLFEMADNGTLFLDEINSMELEAQAKILRAIEEQKIRRIGDKRVRDVNVRIIAAMNEDPLECVKQRKIREDLYYRLSVIRYDLPELKERRQDIPLLMEYFRKELNQKLNKNIIEYSDQVKRVFMNYDWPGNVRELKNVIEGAYHLNYGATIDVENIPKYMLDNIDIGKIVIEDTSDKSLEELVSEFEKKLIETKYVENDRRLSRTAKALQISKQGLWYKIRKYNIDQKY